MNPVGYSQYTTQLKEFLRSSVYTHDPSYASVDGIILPDGTTVSDLEDMAQRMGMDSVFLAFSKDGSKDAFYGKLYDGLRNGKSVFIHMVSDQVDVELLSVIQRVRENNTFSRITDSMADGLVLNPIPNESHIFFVFERQMLAHSTYRPEDMVDSLFTA